jgi:hypothetical protein
MRGFLFCARPGIPAHNLAQDTASDFTPVTDRSKSTMMRCLDSAFHNYRTRGFNITDLHADNEFECISEHILPIHLNPVAADGHVGEV